jgi:signal transduction histidine kinase
VEERPAVNDAPLPPTPPLDVLIVSPPEQQAGLLAALPPAAFHAIAAAAPPAADRPPAVVLFSLETPADLPRVREWAAGGAPVVVLLDPATLPAEAVLAAGAADYVYRVRTWAAVLPFHLRRAAGRTPAAGAGIPRPALARLAHDLRGPLTYLVGYSELLMMRDLPPEQVRQMAEEMLREAEKLSQRLDSFLASS